MDTQMIPIVYLDMKAIASGFKVSGRNQVALILSILVVQHMNQFAASDRANGTSAAHATSHRPGAFNASSSHRTHRKSPITAWRGWHT